MIDTLLLDLDNTILDFDAAEKDSFRKMLEEYKVSFTEEIYEQYRAINDTVWLEIENNTMRKEDAFKQRFTKLFEIIGLDVKGQDGEDTFRHYLNHSHHMMPYAQEVLQTLKKQGVRLYSASNGVYQTQMNRLDAAGINHYFDGHFISEQLGYTKPHKAFFDECRKRLNIESFGDNVLMVGDNLRADIQGACQANLRACFYNPSGKELDHPAQYEISDLRELFSIIEGE